MNNEHETGMPHCWCNPEKRVLSDGSINVIHKKETYDEFMAKENKCRYCGRTSEIVDLDFICPFCSPPHDNKTEETINNLTKSIDKLKNLGVIAEDKTEESWEAKYDKEFPLGFFSLRTPSEIRKKFKSFITSIVQDTRKNTVEDIKQLKLFHKLELDAISCKSLEDFIIWSENRKALLTNVKED